MWSQMLKLKMLQRLEGMSKAELLFGVLKPVEECQIFEDTVKLQHFQILSSYFLSGARVVMVVVKLLLLLLLLTCCILGGELLMGSCCRSSSRQLT
jgi:hypothetical protein